MIARREGPGAAAILGAVVSVGPDYESENAVGPASHMSLQSVSRTRGAVSWLADSHVQSAANYRGPSPSQLRLKG